MSADPYSTDLESWARDWKYRELMRMRLGALAVPVLLLTGYLTRREVKEGELHRRTRCRMAGIEPGPVGAMIWPPLPVRSRHHGGSGCS